MSKKTHRNHKCGWITRGGLVQDTDAQTKANSLFQALASTLSSTTCILQAIPDSSIKTFLFNRKSVNV
jgi:hypothetical protein